LQEVFGIVTITEQKVERGDQDLEKRTGWGITAEWVQHSRVLEINGTDTAIRMYLVYTENV
jgi:hypothetical protein